MQLVAGDPRRRKCGANRLLIAVHFRRIKMTIAQSQRTLDRGAGGIALHAEGAKPESGQADGLSLQIFHWLLLKAEMRRTRGPSDSYFIGGDRSLLDSLPARPLVNQDRANQDRVRERNGQSDAPMAG